VTKPARALRALGVLAAFVPFDPRNRVCFDPLSSLGFAFESVDYRLSPSRKGETHQPLTVFRFDRFEDGLRPRPVHGIRGWGAARIRLEGAARSTVGQGEKVGQAMNDSTKTAQGYYDDAAGKARSALGNAKDAVSGGVDAVSALDFSALRDQISQLTQKVVPARSISQISSLLGGSPWA